MNAPLFLDVQEVIEIHGDQIDQHGGIHGIRDPGSLESAVVAAEFAACHESEDLFWLAATYMVHLIQNHPFLDGNKRTGVKAALVFLVLNGIQLKRDTKALRQLEDLAVAVAARQAGKEKIAEFLRRWLTGK